MFTAQEMIDLSTTVAWLTAYPTRSGLTKEELQQLGEGLSKYQIFFKEEFRELQVKDLFDLKNPKGEIKALHRAINRILRGVSEEKHWRCIYYFAKRCGNHFAAQQALQKID